MSVDIPDETEALGRVVAVINGKGGVGKTSVTANLAGVLAGAGSRVLVIDLDVSGNLKLDLGMADRRDDSGKLLDDRGKSLLDAVWSAHPLRIVPEVRPGLDMVFGGMALEMLTSLAHSQLVRELPSETIGGEFAARLREVADDYDLILLDCPPGNGELQDMALAAATWVLVPTKTDPGSWDGLLGVGPRVKRARNTNPNLRYLGVVIVAHNPQAKRVRRNTEQMLVEVGHTVPLLDTVIRHSEAAAQDCRVRGQLAHELASDVELNRSRRMKALHSRRATGTGDMPSALADTADSLAADYKRLAREVIGLIGAAEKAAATVGAGA